MRIVPIETTQMENIAPLFAGWEETMVYSCLQGCMGSAWANGDTPPSSAIIVIADFYFLGGKPDAALVRAIPALCSGAAVVVPQSEAWHSCIENTLGRSVQKATRYAIKKETGVFNTAKLRTLVAGLEGAYTLCAIDEPLYHKLLEQDWSRDLCAQYAGYPAYHAHGLGFVALHGGVPVAGASSYTWYTGGIEIEIDTCTDHRRKGLATACGAALVLECLARGLYPSWDAHNLWSVGLAEKLGYHFEKEYPIYLFTTDETPRGNNPLQEKEC